MEYNSENNDTSQKKAKKIFKFYGTLIDLNNKLNFSLMLLQGLTL